MTNVQMNEGEAAALAQADEATQSSGAAPEVVKNLTARAGTTKRKAVAVAAAPRAKPVRAPSANKTRAGKPSRAASATTGRPEADGKVSKTDAVVKMLRAARGATIAQIGMATGWQAHSVRGFLSGTVRKKLGLTLTSETGKDGERRYRIVPAAMTPTADMHAASAGRDDRNLSDLTDSDQASADGDDPRAGG